MQGDTILRNIHTFNAFSSYNYEKIIRHLKELYKIKLTLE